MRQPTPCYLLFLPFPRISRSSFSFTNLLVYGRGYNDRLITRNRIERCLAIGFLDLTKRKVIRVKNEKLQGNRFEKIIAVFIRVRNEWIGTVCLEGSILILIRNKK